MFLEYPKDSNRKRGWIEVICGSMFSGKTEELIRRLKRARFAQQKVEIFKPQVDVRYDMQNVVSHDANMIRCTPVPSSTHLLLLAADVEVVGVDEAQFFDDYLSEVCNQLADNGSRVIVAGLDMDFKGRPFGPIPKLLSTAEYITKVHAICMDCGNLAHYSYRTSESETLIVLGEKENYLPLCRSCYNERHKRQEKEQVEKK